MTVWQHQRLRGDFAAQFAERHNGAGEGHRPDKDAEEHLRQVDIHQDRLQARLVVQVAVKAHQYGGQTHEAVQDRHQLRHFGHLNFLRQMNTNRATNNHRYDDPGNITGIRPKDGGDQRNRHPGDTKAVPLLRGFML